MSFAREGFRIGMEPCSRIQPPGIREAMIWSTTMKLLALLVAPRNNATRSLPLVGRCAERRSVKVKERHVPSGRERGPMASLAASLLRARETERRGFVTYFEKAALRASLRISPKWGESHSYLVQ